MPNLTVSSAVDTMMQAADAAGIRTAIGAPGSDTQVMLNSSGVLGASSLLTFDGNTAAVGGASTAAPILQVNMPASHADNAFEVLDSVGNSLADFSNTGCNIRGYAASYYPQVLVNGSTTQIRGDGASSGAYVQVVGTGKWALANGEQSQWWTNGQAIGGGTNFILGGHNSSPGSSPTGSTNAFALDCANRVLHIGPTKNASPTNSYLRGVGGVGTDIAGADLFLDAGAGTGAAAGGALHLRSSQSGVSGTTLQSWSTVLQIDPDDKIGVFGATPVVQPSSTGETTGFTAGSGTGVNDDSTFTGNVGITAYRINDVVKALKQVGWLAP